MGIFGVKSVVTLENVVEVDGTTTVVPEAGVVLVTGSLEGNLDREIELTADPVSSLGYSFKEWIIETTPITLIEVGVSAVKQTVEEVCMTNNFEISEAVYTDDQFFYLNQEGTIPAESGYYGIGRSRYVYHSTAQGLSGPYECGAANPGGNTTGGGNNTTPSVSPPGGDNTGGTDESKLPMVE